MVSKKNKVILIDLTKSDEPRAKEMVVENQVDKDQVVGEAAAKNSQGQSEFIPVTAETLDRALELMSNFETSKRAVAIVFDPCFFMPNISIEYIRSKFQRIFGEIKRSQVLLRTSMPRLMRNVEEANEYGIKNLNQAYIIAEKGITDAEINRRAGRTKTFCCPMTMGCVINNLKRGIFLMSRNVLVQGKPLTISRKAFDNSAPQRQLQQNSAKNKACDDTVQQSKLANKSISSTRRNRLAAVLNGACEDARPNSSGDHTPQPPGGKNNVSAATKSQAKNAPAAANPAKQNGKLDTALLNKLSKHGDVVVRVDNLPAKLTVHALNLMMGTFSLSSQQIVATKPITNSKGQQLMNIRIVLRQNNEDLKRILCKDKCRTAYGSVLHIERLGLKSLRPFLAENHSNLRELETDDKLPINRIGYGKIAVN